MFEIQKKRLKIAQNTQQLVMIILYFYIKCCRYLNAVGIRIPDIRITEPFDYWTFTTNNRLVQYLNGQNMFDHQMVCYSNHDLNTKQKVSYSSHDLNSRQKSVFQVMNHPTYDLNNGLIVGYLGHALNTRLFVQLSGHGLNNGPFD